MVAYVIHNIPYMELSSSRLIHGGNNIIDCFVIKRYSINTHI